MHGPVVRFVTRDHLREGNLSLVLLQARGPRFPKANHGSEENESHGARSDRGQSVWRLDGAALGVPNALEHGPMVC